jgi:hypothetical protein
MKLQIKWLGLSLRFLGTLRYSLYMLCSDGWKILIPGTTLGPGVPVKPVYTVLALSGTATNLTEELCE